MVFWDSLNFKNIIMSLFERGLSRKKPLSRQRESADCNPDRGGYWEVKNNVL